MQSFAKRQRAQTALAVVGVDAGKFAHALVVRPRGAQDSRPVTFPTSRAGFDDAAARVLTIVRAAHPAATPPTSWSASSSPAATASRSPTTCTTAASRS